MKKLIILITFVLLTVLLTGISNADSLSRQEILDLFDITYEYDSKDKEAKKQARQDLIDNGAFTTEVLIDRLGTKDVIERITLYDIFKTIGEDSLPYLFGALEDPNPDARYRAADIIGQIGSPSGRNPLRVRLMIEIHATSLAFTIKSLGLIGDDRDVEMIAGFRDHESEPVRRQVANALGSIGDSSGVEFLIDMLGDDLFSVRNPAVLALSKIGKPAMKPLAKALDPVNDIHLTGMIYDTFAEMGDPWAITQIFTAFAHDDVQLKRYASIALSKVDDPNFIEALERMQKINDDPLINYQLRSSIKKLKIKQEEESDE